MDMPLHTEIVASGAWAVTAPHALATQAGAEILARGGNAIEAALAVSAALTVVYPHMNSLGGDAFWLIADSDGGLRGLDGAGPAGAAVNAEVYLSQGYTQLPERGPLAANTVPGLLSTWEAAYAYSRAAWNGRQPWAGLLERALGFAADGFSASRSQRSMLAQALPALQGSRRFLDHFLPRGEMPAAGGSFQQPALARTLEELQTHGAESFYRGALAGRIAQGLRAEGSLLTQDDLAAYRCRWVEPIGVPYSTGRLVNLPPPTQGVASLMVLAVMDRHGLAGMDPRGADYIHLAVEATKRVFRLRDRYVADPDFNPVPVAEWLSPAYLDRLAAGIDMRRAQPWPEGIGPGGTAWFGVMDAQGRAVSVIQSLYFEFGSGVVAGDTGILWQNRGCSFSLVQDHVNALRPGKRPFHTLNPAMYLEQGRPVLVYGTMGGEGQPQTQAALVTRAHDFALPLAEVLDSPRWLLGRTWGESSASLKLERRFDEGVYAELSRRGHKVERVPAYSSLMGHAGMIRRSGPGSIEAAADPRGDGAALAG